MPVALIPGSVVERLVSGYVWTESEKVMNETLFPVGILLQYSWAPFLASSSFFPAIEWLLSRTMMCWNLFASACFSATSGILRTASTFGSYEWGWFGSVLTGG